MCQTTIVEDAWARGQNLTVHGLVYGLADGLLHDLDVSRGWPAHWPEVPSAAAARRGP